MPTAFDPDGRGPSAARLLVTGVCFLTVIAAAATAMIAQSRGVFRSTVAVTAVLADVGDGLPAKSDVKYRGVLVGSVRAVLPSSEPGMNDVELQLDPHFAARIPDTVTARVVPSNVFAVPSIQLLGDGAAPPLAPGARIAQDRSLATVRLQSALDQLRRIIAAVGRDGTDRTVGMLAVLAEATQGRGANIENAGARLRDIVEQLRTVVSVDAAPSTLDSLSAALRNLRSAAPDLLDALHHSLLPMLTVARDRQQLTDLLTGGISTFSTARTALDNNTGRIIDITTHISPMLGVLGDGAAHFPQISASVTRLNYLMEQSWNPATQLLTPRVIVSLTPNRQYTRADCPRYGDLAGPSCATGPTASTAAASLPPGLSPGRFQPGALLGGDIGPVGSAHEQQQIAGILGGTPNAAADILFGPLARGATVGVAPDPNGGGR